jgi:hypothetical protein
VNHRRRLDIIPGLLHVARICRSKPDRAVAQMFAIAKDGDAPPEWRRGLKRLAKQLRRATGYEAMAMKAAKGKRYARALEHIRHAEKIANEALPGLASWSLVRVPCRATSTSVL